ncbi:MAG: hypothetical protein IJH00_04770 [Erysipelotrichaceae bacterium]|nr:hypothetical protein [Erysipelotrichaceae bacterium]
MLYSMEDEPRQIRLLIEEHERKARAEAEVEARTKAKDKLLEATISHFMEKGYSKEDAEKEAKEIFEKF